MRMATMTSSGDFSRTRVVSCAASPAWPAISKPDRASKLARPSRKSTSSSASTTLIPAMRPRLSEYRRQSGGMMGPSRWFGVGQASGDDAEPGAKAAKQALQHPDAKLIIVFCSIALNLNAVLRQIRDQAPMVPLIGCTTAGEIATSGPGDAGVVVAALGGDGFSVKTACATEASGDLRGAGASAARCMNAIENREHRVLMLLTDSLSGDQQEIVRGAYQVLGAGVPLVGGGAGDDAKMAKTYQLHNDQVLTDAVVAAGSGSHTPLRIGVRHGRLQVGNPMLVTRSGGNRVFTLDDEPALDVYLEHLGYGGMWPEDQRLLARIAQTHPLALARRVGEDQIRFIAGGDFKDRSLTCIAELPQAGFVFFLDGDP